LFLILLAVVLLAAAGTGCSAKAKKFIISSARPNFMPPTITPAPN